MTFGVENISSPMSDAAMPFRADARPMLDSGGARLRVFTLTTCMDDDRDPWNSPSASFDRVRPQDRRGGTMIRVRRMTHATFETSALDAQM
jgi:hypothetical protein